MTNAGRLFLIPKHQPFITTSKLIFNSIKVNVTNLMFSAFDNVCKLHQYCLNRYSQCMTTHASSTSTVWTGTHIVWQRMQAPSVLFEQVLLMYDNVYKLHQYCLNRYSQCMTTYTSSISTVWTGTLNVWQRMQAPPVLFEQVLLMYDNACKLHQYCLNRFS